MIIKKRGGGLLRNRLRVISIRLSCCWTTFNVRCKRRRRRTEGGNHKHPSAFRAPNNKKMRGGQTTDALRFELCKHTHTHTTSLEAKSWSASSLSWVKGKLLPSPSPLFEIEKKKTVKRRRGVGGVKRAKLLESHWMHCHRHNNSTAFWEKISFDFFPSYVSPQFLAVCGSSFIFYFV